MKNIFFFLFFFCILSLGAFSQRLPDYGINRIRLTQSDETIVATIEPVSSNPSIKQNLLYYWYSANTIHHTQGGFSGKLLNGLYTAYYPNKNLKEQGNFKKGLKDGIWKNWNEDGSFAKTCTWNNGIEITGGKPPIWKRILPFRKKAKAGDTINNVKK
jgi:hypothetical protein